ELEFFAKPQAPELTLLDSETGSEWDFTGKATSGPLKGRQLNKLPILADYWFDWKNLPSRHWTVRSMRHRAMVPIVAKETETHIWVGRRHFVTALFES